MIVTGNILGQDGEILLEPNAQLVSVVERVLKQACAEVIDHIGHTIK